MEQINQHVAQVDRAAQFQLQANHLAWRVHGARHALMRSELACPPNPRVVRAIALVAVREMQVQRTVSGK